MIVSELIAFLQGCPKDIFVLVQGYEGGWTDLKLNSIEICDVVPNSNNTDYYGPHEKAEDVYTHDWEEKPKAVPAVCFGR